MDNNATMLTHGYKQGVTNVDNGLFPWLEDNTASLALPDQHCHRHEGVPGEEV